MNTIQKLTRCRAPGGPGFCVICLAARLCVAALVLGLLAMLSVATITLHGCGEAVTGSPPPTCAAGPFTDSVRAGGLMDSAWVADTLGCPQ